MTFSDKQVEAAAKAINGVAASKAYVPDDWDELGPEVHDEWKVFARAALDAVSGAPVGEGDGERVAEPKRMIVEPGVDIDMGDDGTMTLRPSRLPSTEPVDEGLAHLDWPPELVRDCLNSHGMEANEIGTKAALDALTVECPECYGAGQHQDDSHPSNPVTTCDVCSGHRVVLPPAPSEPGEGGTRVTHIDQVLDYDGDERLISPDGLVRLRDKCDSGYFRNDGPLVDVLDHVAAVEEAFSSGRLTPAEANDSSGPHPIKTISPTAPTPVQEEQS